MLAPSRCALLSLTIAHDGTAHARGTMTQPSTLVSRGALYKVVRGADKQLSTLGTHGVVILACAALQKLIHA